MLPLGDAQSRPLDGVATATESGRPRRGKATKPSLTSAQQLASMIKSVRDLLRKDAGLSGDADRLPQVTWLLFLKALDDFDYAREEEYGDIHEPVIEPPYRWRDWAAVADKTTRMTGDELLGFVNGQLIPYLSRLSGSGERDVRTIVGAIFAGISNRIRSGYILREVVDKLSLINFNSSDDIHTLSLFYETMLREMRDAAGDSGEFYTPRPLVRFIVDRVAPKLGEKVLDPACGTDGFLVETWERLKGEARRPDQRESLQRALVGIEKKALAVSPLRDEPAPPRDRSAQRRRAERPGDESPPGPRRRPGRRPDDEPAVRRGGGEGDPQQLPRGDADRGDGAPLLPVRDGHAQAAGRALRHRPAQRLPLRDRHRRRSQEAAAHPLQPPHDRPSGHGVFAPYTSIPTNLLFFEAGDPDALGLCTREVWYYELPLPEGRSGYAKTKPLRFEEFADCIAWWDRREENERAWKVPVEQVAENGYNLDLKNPRARQDLGSLSPRELVDDIVAKERRILDLLTEIKAILSAGE